MARMKDILKTSKKLQQEVVETAKPSQPSMPEELADAMSKAGLLPPGLPLEKEESSPVEDAKPVPDVPTPSPEDLRPDAEDYAQLQYDNALSTIEPVLRSAQEGHLFDIMPVIKRVSSLIDAIHVNQDLLLKRVVRENGLQFFLIAHSVNVTILSLAIGLELGYTTERLTGLGLSAILHDVGMATLPQSLLYKTDPISDQEMELIRKHPIASSEILSDAARDFPWLKQVVLQEHERADGSGYPNALTGQDINELAQIIGIADEYDALTHSRSYHNRSLPPKALKQLFESGRHRFAPKIVRALINAATLYPPGTLVRLNTGQVARVLKTNKARPTRPTVDILASVTGKSAEHKVIDLQNEPMLNIMEGVEESAIS